MKQVIAILLCLLCSLNTFSQDDPVKGFRAELSSARTDSARIEAYKHFITYYSKRNPDSSVWYSTQALEFCRRNHDKIGEAEMYCQLAYLDEAQGRLNLARQRLEMALKLATEAGGKKSLAHIYSDLGAVEGEQGHFDTAIKLLLGSLKLHEGTDDKHALMVTAMNLGSIYLQHDDTANARKYLMEAERISKTISLTDKVLGLYNMIGILYASTGQLELGLQYFTRSLELSNKPEFIRSHVESLLYLGNFYHDAGDLAKSLEYLKEGLAITGEYNMPEMQADILLEMAAAVKDQQPAEAIGYLQKAKEIAQSAGLRAFLVSVYRDLANIYQEQGNYKDALTATNDRQRLADSIFNINKTREIASIAAAYEVEKSGLKVKELEEQNKRSELQRNVIFIVAVGVVVILIVVFIYFRRTQALNKKLKQHQEALNELNNMKNKFFSIVGHDLRAPVSSIPAILDIYEDSRTSEAERKEMLAMLKEQSRASAEMLDKLLLWGQSLVKGVRMQAQEVVLKNCIKENIGFKRIAAAEKQITVEDHTPATARVYADPVHCDFIIRNLLANAIKYTHPGGRIDIAADTQNRPGFTIISVKDNGVGIAPAALPGIFNPVSSALGTANETGTGIGLMLCREFARVNGGDIWVESELDKGAAFYLSLPAVP